MGKNSSDMEMQGTQRTISAALFGSGQSEADTQSMAGSSVWGTEHTPTKSYLFRGSQQGSALLGEARDDGETARERWLFLPSDRWLRAWTNFMHAIVIVSGFFAPLRYALLDPQDVGAIVLDSTLASRSLNSEVESDTVECHFILSGCDFLYRHLAELQYCGVHAQRLRDLQARDCLPLLVEWPLCH